MVVKNLLVKQENFQVKSLDQEDPLERVTTL